MHRRFLAQSRDRERKLVAAARRLAEPERNRRRRALRILDAHASALDAQDAIRHVAELENITGDAFDREVLVDRADHRRLRLEHDIVVGRIRNRAAGRDRGQPRATPRAQDAVHRVAMQVRGTLADARRVPFREHAHDCVEIFALQTRVRVRAAHEIEQRVLAPILAGDFGDDLLREHVERIRNHAERIELASVHGVEQRGRFDQFVARERKKAAFRQSADRMAGSADALQERGDRARRSDLADQIDIADVDAELERCGRDQRAQLAAFQALLGLEAQFLGEAAVMRGDRFLAEAFAQMFRRALDHASRVDENQRRVMLTDQRFELRVDLLPHIAGHHGFERCVRKLDRKIAIADVAGVDDLAFGAIAAVCCLVIPAQARIQRFVEKARNWIPALAGMTSGVVAARASGVIAGMTDRARQL